MDFAKLTAYLDSFHTEKNIPGVGCAVYHRHKPVYEHYTGYSDVENKTPFGPDTIFKLYSATKVMTCTAALQLMERGMFRLSDPIGDYIPEFSNMLVRSTRPDGSQELTPAKNTISIEHLFSMTAGIDIQDTEEVRKAVAARGPGAGTLDVVRAYAGIPLAFEPGTHFKYNACHDVLGALIEVLSGKRFGEYLRDHIIGPLGMKDTSFELADEKRFCKLYNRFDAKTGRSESVGESFGFILKPTPAYECGGGGLYSTVRDYALLAETLCNGGVAPNGERILGRETIDNMRTRRLSADAQHDFSVFGQECKRGYSYGLGVRTLIDREANNSLSCNGEFGWDGARGCYFLADPDAELAIFYAQQENGSQWWNWHGMVRNYVYASVWGD